jgi:hypothetical protein
VVLARQAALRLFSLPRTFNVDTFSTLTEKIDSMAALICGFVASRATLKAYWFDASVNVATFSEKCGASRIVK